MNPNTETWTTRRLLEWTTQYFTQKQLDNPRLRAEMLLAHVLGVQRIKLYMQLDRPASELERATFRDLVERAVKHEPVQYLVGSVVFYGLEINVDSRVLIPRPSTEAMVDLVLHECRTRGYLDEPNILDLCTGSGAIALALTKNLKKAGLTATDISPEALTVAKKNAEKLNLNDRIRFQESDLFAQLTGQVYDVIVSNPPYIRDSEWGEVEPNVKDHEPTLALRAGHDGLDVIRRLLDQARGHLKSTGLIFIEISSTQKLEALNLIATMPEYTNAHVAIDDERFDRFLIAERV